MVPHSVLANLHRIHGLLAGLLESVSESDSRRNWHPDLAPLAWYFGRAVYLEAYWLRERIADDADLTGRVRHIFADRHGPAGERIDEIPPGEHLLNWALEIFEHDLTRLANPGMLPPHPLLEGGWIVDYLVQVLSRVYEEMVLVLGERALATDLPAWRVHVPLVPRLPAADAAAVNQGHYRVGARDGVVFDNEQPAKAVELHNFRIQRQPVSNAEWLAFLVDGGYEDPTWWSEAGNAWRTGVKAGHPHHWRRDAAGRWFGVGVGGAADLVADDPVHGISSHEAGAFARWAAARGEGLGGAVVQHEFQWEAAARGGHLGSAGRVWEWCANRFEPYVAYEAPGDHEMVTREFDGRHIAVRGAAVHTRPAIRRASYRNGGLAESRHRWRGVRLVLPSA
jgi:iron(II)-dependent oxidoreductase